MTEYIFNHTFSSMDRVNNLFTKLYLAIEFVNNNGEKFVGYVFEQGEPLSLMGSY